MSKEEIEAMKQARRKPGPKPKSAARAEDQLPDDEPEVVETEAEVIDDQAPAEVYGLVYGLVTAGGGILCARAEVPGLTDDEKHMIAEPVAKLLTLYDVSVQDPKVAAWLGLGGGLAAVVVPRIRLKPKPANDQEEARPSMPASDTPGAYTMEGKDPDALNPDEPAPLEAAQDYTGA